MKSIADLSYGEHCAMVDKIVEIARAQPGKTIMIWQLSLRTKRSQKWLYEFVESSDVLQMNAAVRTGSGIYALPKREHEVYIDEEEYKESLTYRK